MPGLSLSNFFPDGSCPPSIASRWNEVPPLSSQPKNLLLYGPERCGKTALLFHLAYSLANQGASVLIIASRERLEYNPPNLIQRLGPSDPCWSRIQIKYIEDQDQLVQFASFLHLARPAPSVILIDDIDRFTSLSSPNTGTGHKYGGDDVKNRTRDMALCHLLAVLVDSMEYTSNTSGVPTLIAATATTTGSSDAPRLLHLFQRWLPLTLRCWQQHSYHPGGGGSSDKWHLAGVLPAARGSEGPVPQGWAAEYSLCQGLELLNVAPLEPSSI